MPKLHLLIGLPASGKSTFAAELVRDGAVRINGDDLRESMSAGFCKYREPIVHKTMETAAACALTEGINVVVDNTNLNPRVVAKWHTLAKNLNAELIETRFDVPLHICIDRDRIRQKRVGAHVINRMALQYGLIQFSKPLVLVDIDGTLADCTERRHLCSSGSKMNWDLFFAYVKMDDPRSTVVEWVRELFKSHEYTICIISARPDRVGIATEDWLLTHHIPFHHLFLVRPDGDYTPDHLLKKAFLKRLTERVSKNKIAWVIDDRPRVIRMWRDEGLRVFDVGDGKEF